ncbi:MAG: hypothetical protein ACRBCL_03400 [Maritimibacter sp.]
MRVLVLPMLIAAVTAGCAGRIPDSAAGVGFDDYETYNRQAQGAAVQSQPLSEGEQIARETTSALGLNTQSSATSTSTMPPPMSAMGANASNAAPVATQPTTAGSASLSDEQNFQAVSGRETIQSDAQRIANNRAQYQVIQPTELPQRPDGSGASIVSFALATNNAVGQPLYNRSGFNAKARFERNCAKHASPDKAQEAFLDAGGPERDRAGLDPDGDGFACYWNPAPFRAARGGAPEQVTKYVDVETPGVSE